MYRTEHSFITFICNARVKTDDGHLLFYINECSDRLPTSVPIKDNHLIYHDAIPNCIKNHFSTTCHVCIHSYDRNISTLFFYLGPTVCTVSCNGRSLVLSCARQIDMCNKSYKKDFVRLNKELLGLYFSSEIRFISVQ